MLRLNVAGRTGFMLFLHECRHDVVPVVMGAPRVDYERAAPPGSFIHVDDFESPRQLAEFLRAVAADRDRYNSYFRWRGAGEYIDTKFWCRLCAMLHESRRSDQHIVYERLNDWWRGAGACIEKAAPGKAWMSWRDVHLPDLLNTSYHRLWLDNSNVGLPGVPAVSRTRPVTDFDPCKLGLFPCEHRWPTSSPVQGPNLQNIVRQIYDSVTTS